jgi:hypothetical protein
MSWIPSIGEIVEGISTAVDRYLARDERTRIAAARAKAVYRLRLAEQEAARVAAQLEAARLAAIAAAEAEELYDAVERDAAAKAADGSEP